MNGAERNEFIRRAKACAAIPAFSQWLPQVTPTYTWDWPYQVYIDKQLDRLIDGDINKLMLFLPPRHGKSEKVTIRLPAWILERAPQKRVIIGAYNQTLANRFSRRTRRIAESRIRIALDRAAVEEWETTAGGGLRAVGVGGGITGYGGDFIIIDDPVKSREEANSATYRDKVWDWYTNDLYTRREPGAKMLLIMTRWHHDDLAGRILKSEDGPNWTVIKLPALAEEGDPLGRAVGEALCPARFSSEELAAIKSVLGSSDFESLFQQHPTPQEGDIFKREWWKYYREAPVFLAIIQSWDTGFKDQEKNDFSVCTTWGVTRTGYYLLDLWRNKVQFPELKRALVYQARTWNPIAIIVEDKASGQSLIQEIQRDTDLPIIPFPAEKDKVVRATAVTPTVEAGKVYLPETAPWLGTFIDELSDFSGGEHDDIVDSTSHALAYLRGHWATVEVHSTGVIRATAGDMMRRYAGRQTARKVAANY